MTEKAYRYRDQMYAGMPLMTIDGSDERGSSTMRLVCDEFTVLRHTPKGFWIRDWRSMHEFEAERWIGKEHKKQYASLTKEEAMRHFIARKRRQIEIYEARLKTAKQALRKALQCQ